MLCVATHFLKMKIDVIQIEQRRTGILEIKEDVEFIYGVETAAPIFISEIGRCNLEKVAMLCLDSTNRIINYSIVSIGEMDKVKPSVSQIVKTALVSNASKVIVAHNHPSGILELTAYDYGMTKKIGGALGFFGIELIDSIVVNDNGAKSVREELVKQNEQE